MATNASPDRLVPRWRSQAMFVSGTFRDFHAERDAIAKRVLPTLEENIAEHRVHLELVDLRIGVETLHLHDDHARQELVLKVCLGDVDRCRPFLVVLLGDRYGWVPPPERAEAATRQVGLRTDVRGKSVTELEIEFGLSPNSPTRSFVYFRSLATEGMAEEDAVAFSDKRAADSRLLGAQDRERALERSRRLEVLKHRLRSHPLLGPRCRDYSAYWDAQTRRVSGLEEFVGQLLHDLSGELIAEAEHKLEDLAERPPVSALERFFESRSRGFLGREALLAQLVELATESKDRYGPGRIILTGASGAGKSALLAALQQRLKGTGVWLLAHAAGIEPGSDEVDGVLRGWLRTLHELAVQEPGWTVTYQTESGSFESTVAESIAAHLDTEHPEHSLHSLLPMVTARHRVVLLVDGLERMERSARVEQSTWIGVGNDNVRVIATAKPGPETAWLSSSNYEAVWELPALGVREATDIIHGIYARHHRSANPRIIDALLTKAGHESTPAHQNPLWLVTATEELNRLDADDFLRADHELVEDKEAQLQAMLLREAQELPSDIAGLYEHIFERASRLLSDDEQLGRALMGSFLTLLGLSRIGLRERDLTVLVPLVAKELAPNAPEIEWNSLAFAVIRRAYRVHLSCLGDDQRWTFHHPQALEGVMAKLQERSGLGERLHCLVADYLLGLPGTDELRQSEVAYHLLRTRDVRRLFGQLRDVQGLEAWHALARALVELAGSDEGGTLLVEAVWDGLSDIDNLELAGRLLVMLDLPEWQGPLSARLELAWAVMQALRALANSTDPNDMLDELLSNAYTAVGATLEEQGRLEEATMALQNCLSLQLAVAERGGTPGQGQRSWAYQAMRTFESIQRLDSRCGSIGEVIEGYGILLNRCRVMVASAPEVDEFQHDLGRALCLLGDAELARGGLDAATAAYEEALAISESATEQDFGRLDWQREAKLAQAKLARMHELRDDTGRARALLIEVVTIYRWIASVAPDQLDWQFELAHHLRSLADLEDRAVAAPLHESAVKWLRRLIVARPERINWQASLGVSLASLARIHVERGEPSRALPLFDEAVSLLCAATSITPWIPEAFENGVEQTSTDPMCDLAVALRGMGETKLRLGLLEPARELLVQSVEACRRLLTGREPRPRWHYELALSLAILSQAARDLSPSMANEDLTEARQIIEALAARQQLFAPWLHEWRRLDQPEQG